MNIRDEIQEEFKEYSEIDIKKNYSIGHAYSQFTTGEDGAGRNFGFIKKSGRGRKKPVLVKKRRMPSSEYQKKQFEKKLIFCKTLKEFSNKDYARKLSGLGPDLAKYYIEWLNREAEKLGMPAIFQKKMVYPMHTAKLNKKQVSYIKYLVTKYPATKICKMYNISNSTIGLIKRGLIWKEVKPAIENHGII